MRYEEGESAFVLVQVGSWLTEGQGIDTTEIRSPVRV